MMYDELYEFLIHYKQLPVPGIGTFVVDRKPANLDFPGKQILPPAYSVYLLPSIHSSSRKFHNWLSQALKASDTDAVIRFNDFAYELKKKISEGSRVSWKGVGILSKGLSGNVKLDAERQELFIEDPVPAERVLRENPTHLLRVGEDEK